MKVLVVDDDRSAMFLAEDCASGCGHEVVTANDGVEAWDILDSESPPELVLLDRLMPRMDGLEVCERIRRHPALGSVYVILVTSKDGASDISEGLDAGADDYVTKPFEPNELRARICVGERMVAAQSALAKKIEELEESLEHVKTLQGILPICMYCHKIKDDHEAWQRIEDYITMHSEAQCSHGLCPECARKHYPEDYKLI